MKKSLFIFIALLYTQMYGVPIVRIINTTKNNLFLSLYNQCNTKILTAEILPNNEYQVRYKIESHPITTLKLTTKNSDNNMVMPQKPQGIRIEEKYNEESKKWVMVINPNA